MHYRYDKNIVRLDRIENGVGKYFSQAAADIVLDDAPGLGRSCNVGNGHFDRTGEALTQSYLLLLVILGSGAEFGQGFRVELDTHRAMACRTSANAASAGTV